MVTLTIDGKTVEVPEGTTVLNAARQAGIEIPTLCDHPELTPYGGCRLCLVEIDGFRTMQTSCTIPATNNMVVKTDTPKVQEARKFVLTLIFSERNHFCPYCQVSGGDCELQNSAYDLGMTHWPLQPNWTPFPVDASHPYIVLDHNRCILCRRCVRACGELVGNYTLGFEERGAQSRLMADLGVPLGESTCVSCGVCLQVCPTGALIDRWSAYRGHETDVETHKTICAGCSVGCSVDVITRDNSLVRIEGDWEGVANHGVLCEVGRFQPMTEKRQRLVTPLVRKNGALKAATWEEAYAAIAENFSKNAGSVAAIASTRLPAEALYTFRKLFADGLKSDLVTTTEEGTGTAAANRLAESLGVPFEGSLASLDEADFVLTVGEDLTRSHQVAGFFVKRHLQGGLKLVVVDAEENGLDTWANVSLKPAGSIAETLRALMVGLSGTATEDVAAAAELLSTAARPVFVYGKDLAAKDPQALAALVDLAKVARAEIVGTKGGANSTAAGQLGLEQPIVINGQQAAFVSLADEEPTQRFAQKLSGLPFLVVQASYASQLSASADVVLPAETWLEQTGHYVSLDGRVQAAQSVLHAPEGVRSTQAALVEIAARLGFVVDDRWQESLCERPSAVAIAA